MFLSDAMKKKKVFGEFQKFLYRCNGMVQFVYCRNATDFLKLLDLWNNQSRQFCHSRFNYTYGSVVGRIEIHDAIGVPMSLDQIVADLFVKDFSTEGSRILKSVLRDPYTNVEYIQ